MFEFKNFEAVHWDFWQRIAIPLDGQINTVVGPNGSGKTTLLDGIRTLLGIRCSSERDYRRYVRRKKMATSWLRSVVKNERTARGFAAFFPIVNSEVTLACRIRRKGGDWERHYCILEGDVPIEQLEEKAGKDWFGLNEYNSLLAKAGLRGAIRKVLTLEQGATDELCTRSPREILNLVFEAYGEQKTLDNYQKAKDDQAIIKQELDELDRDLASLGLEIQTNQGKIDNYNEWKRKTEDVYRLLTEDIPRMELMEQSEQSVGARRNIKGIRRKVAEKRETLVERRQTLSSLNTQIQEAESSKCIAQSEEDSCRASFSSVSQQLTSLKKTLQEKERLESLVTTRNDGFDAEDFTQKLDAAHQDKARIENRIKEISKQIKEDTGRQTRLEVSNQKDLPKPTDDLIKALKNAGVSAQVFRDTVEIPEPSWQPAIEGLIAGEAFTILLDNPDDRKKAQVFGEDQKYRSLITADRKDKPKPRVGSILEMVEFSAPVQSWVIDLLNRTMRVEDVHEGNFLPQGQDYITRKGYHSTQRGGRYVGVDLRSKFTFGTGAVRAELEEIAVRLRDLREEAGKLGEELNTAKDTITDCQRLLNGWDADAELKSKLHEFTDAEKRLPEIQEQHDSLESQVEGASKKRVGFENTINALNKALGNVEGQIKTMDEDIFAAQRTIKGEQSKLQDWRKSILSIRLKIPVSGRTKEILADLKAQHETLAGAKKALELRQDDLQSQEWETDPVVIQIGARLVAEYKTKEETVSKRRGDNNRALMEIQHAREQYIHVLKATLNRYIKNVRALSAIAGVEVRHKMPVLVNDDLSLASAGLQIEFRFDRKETDETSGGQKVIKSLILLVSLMMDQGESGGFIFIDEPFAHLDVMNIALVSNFLRSSGAQFVLTTPSTHDIKVFETSDITLSTRTWRSPEPWAPQIAWARRQKTEDAA
ncbi:AAA family ATPase [Desulfuromonas acetoxidans]|uniref:SMC protein-like n=1 Tax=Desulfuromonas acetoxidans (strain DSM 684 / 11070) TaxID=281689 RepID=Q1K3L4_DESA6|nr:ATP-binding protein [Desulfuromonas acetoxidans]EAT16960.1 SMC protein-like [Desulfuromonas acetoxidans DSM 684]MBF0644509.1 AAA family ATPase [Desulfuromonas acetoxidans]NVD23964.1 AAA family ATPase [Desulfuromonas acetoxidans]NVE16261.1 AAA family ATPase [Desulfuromonas acetoxidans]